MRQLEILTLKKVNENGLIFGGITPFVTPMRLGVILENVSIEVKESIKEIRGPRLGAPANAIDGFLKKNKIERSELQEKKTIINEFKQLLNLLNLSKNIKKIKNYRSSRLLRRK